MPKNRQQRFNKRDRRPSDLLALATSVGIALFSTIAPLASPASAEITVISPALTLITPSAMEDLTEGGPLENVPGSETVYAFNEDQDVSVSGFEIDLPTANLTGGWTAGDATNPVQLTAEISSHYLHFDTLDSNTVTRSGFVEFDAPILGVILSSARLDASDAVAGSGDLLFASGRQLGPPDFLRVEAGERRLVFSLENDAGTDQVRVITGTPSPGGGGAVTEIELTGGESFVAGGLYEGDGLGGNTVYFFAEETTVNVSGLEVDLAASRLEVGWVAGEPTEPQLISGNVDSFYLFFDSVSDTEATTISASVTLPRPVLGVIFSSARLPASDTLLAIPGVSFASPRNLGIPGDAISLDATGRVLSFTLQNVAATDDIRIVVESGVAVPSLTPSTWVLLFSGLCALGARMRRSAPRQAQVQPK